MIIRSWLSTSPVLVGWIKLFGWLLLIGFMEAVLWVVFHLLADLIQWVRQLGRARTVRPETPRQRLDLAVDSPWSPDGTRRLPKPPGAFAAGQEIYSKVRSSH